MDNPTNGESEGESDSGHDASTGQSENDSKKDEQQTLEEVPADKVATTVEEVDSPQPSEAVDSLATFSEQEGSFSVRIIPVVRNSGADWRVNVYAEGVQGPIYQATGRITDEATDQLGMTRRLQDRVNEALEYANQNLTIPEALGNQKRQKKSLHELELMMDDQ